MDSRDEMGAALEAALNEQIKVLEEELAALWDPSREPKRVAEIKQALAILRRAVDSGPR